MRYFYSLQGEGVRAGTTNVFIRFTGCNLRCEIKEGPKSPGGFDCDTEFESGRRVTLEELWEWIQKSVEISTGEVRRPGTEWKGSIILTGGEPGLQVDKDLTDFLHAKSCFLAIETNGTINFQNKKVDLDWITLSPKVAEHALCQLWANEVKYVRGYGQGIPKPAATADNYLISPAFDGGIVHPDTMKHCIKLCLENPTWRLSCQQHKMWKVR